jgi:hypothetical protein
MIKGIDRSTPPSPEAIGNIWPIPTSARKEAAAIFAVNMPDRNTGESSTISRNRIAQERTG